MYLQFRNLATSPADLKAVTGKLELGDTFFGGKKCGQHFIRVKALLLTLKIYQSVAATDSMLTRGLKIFNYLIN